MLNVSDNFDVNYWILRFMLTEVLTDKNRYLEGKRNDDNNISYYVLYRWYINLYMWLVPNGTLTENKKSRVVAVIYNKSILK
jgi:hypothetical protein